MTRNDASKTVKGQRRAPRLDSREQARQNIHGVAVGQVWEDNDKRVQKWGPRHIKVFTIVDLYAECYEVTITGRLTLADDKRYRNGKPRRIRLDRFRPTSTGYRLVSPLPLSHDTPERSGGEG